MLSRETQHNWVEAVRADTHLGGGGLWLFTIHDSPFTGRVCAAGPEIAYPAS